MILLAESGSTKTDWRIIGESVHSFHTIGLNPYFTTSEQISKELTPHLSNQTPNAIKEVHFYGTGITDASKGDIIAKGIKDSLGYKPEIYTYSDVVAAAKSLFGNDEGIACILGTGSNSCYWNGQEVSFQIPPLGFWLGDEGSGGHLGKTFMQAYLHKELPDEIRDKFDNIYGKKDRLEVLNHAYQQEKPNKYFAQFCPFLLDNVQNATCTKLITDSFKQFFEKYLLKYPQLHHAKIGAVGSVAHYFTEPLNKVASNYGLEFSRIVQKPIDALVEYHKR